MEIGVDTAEYIVETDSASINIGTGTDGSVGMVLGLYRGDKLEGLNITLSGFNVNNFDQFNQEFKYLFK